MTDKKAALLAFLGLLVLSLVVVLFIVLGASVWYVHGGYHVAEPTVAVKVVASAICLIPIILAVVVIKLLVVVGGRHA